VIVGSIKIHFPNLKTPTCFPSCHLLKCKCRDCSPIVVNPESILVDFRFGGGPGANPARSGGQTEEIEEVSSQKLAAACECIERNSKNGSRRRKRSGNGRKRKTRQHGKRPGRGRKQQLKVSC